MYIFFLDNSYVQNGTLDLTCLGGFIIDFDKYLLLREEFEKLKINWGLLPINPVKWSPSEGNKEFEAQRKISQQNIFREQVLDLISKADIKIICAFINTDSKNLAKLKKARKLTKDQLEIIKLSYEKKSLEYLAQRFQMELQDINRQNKCNQRGLIIMEMLDGKKSSALVKFYKHIWHDGSGDPHFNIKPDLLFDSITCSHDFGCDGLQLADFIISSMCYASKNNKYDFLDIYAKRIRSRGGKIKGYGIVVYPSNSISVDNLIRHVEKSA